MASTSALVPVEEYLRTSYKPACEYLDGVLRQKPMPTYEHGKMQGRLVKLIDGLGIGYEAIPEQTVQLREGRYLVPDLAIQRLSEVQRPYPTKPLPLCIEIFSPDDRFSEVTAKCEEYHAWGVPVCWLVDSVRQQSWIYEANQVPREIHRDGVLTAGEIRVNAADLFAGF